MSRALIFIAVLITFDSIFCKVIINDATSAIEYLRQYGYLQAKDKELSITNNTLIKHAVSLFQEFCNLPGDGVLNAETVQFMNRPRCGVEDFSTNEFMPLRRSWPKKHLTWNFHLTNLETIRLTQAAFDLWSTVTPLTFERNTKDPDIIISYQMGMHQFADRRMLGPCSVMFDGPGNVLAHAFYPTGREDFISEIHIDAQEKWFVSLRVNPSDTHHLLQTLVHEIGHALGLPHSTRNDSVMFAYAPNEQYPVKLGVEDIQAIQNLYGVKPRTSSSTPTAITPTPKTTVADTHPDLCSLQNIDAIIIVNHRIYIARKHYMWSVGLDGKTYDKPLLLTDYMRFLPANFSHLSAAYQRPTGELVLFANGSIYMIQYPSLTLVSGWPKTYKEIGFPEKTKINAALNTNTGRTFVIFNDYTVAEIDNCNMVIRKYESLYMVFPGVPPGVSMAFRHIDGNLYFITKDRYTRFNEFEKVVTSTGNFDLELVNIMCPKIGILRQLRDLLARLTSVGKDENVKIDGGDN